MRLFLGNDGDHGADGIFAPFLLALVGDSGHELGSQAEILQDGVAFGGSTEAVDAFAFRDGVLYEIHGRFLVILDVLREPFIIKNGLGIFDAAVLKLARIEPALTYLFEKNGLEIFQVEENSINGGSYRLYARKLKNGSIKYPEPVFDYER